MYSDSNFLSKIFHGIMNFFTNDKKNEIIVENANFQSQIQEPADNFSGNELLWFLGCAVFVSMDFGVVYNKSFFLKSQKDKKITESDSENLTELVFIDKQFKKTNNESKNDLNISEINYSVLTQLENLSHSSVQII